MLAPQYAIIGSQLINYETQLCRCVYRAQQYCRDFGISVSFVPVEVLESYLDDLIDLECTDERLCIKRECGALPAYVGMSLLAAVFLAVLFWGALAAPLHEYHFTSLGLLFTALLGGAALVFVYPSRTTRRLRFAHLLSQEIARRRGKDDFVQHDRFLAMGCR